MLHYRQSACGSIKCYYLFQEIYFCVCFNWHEPQCMSCIRVFMCSIHFMWGLSCFYVVVWANIWYMTCFFNMNNTFNDITVIFYIKCLPFIVCLSWSMSRDLLFGYGGCPIVLFIYLFKPLIETSLHAWVIIFDLSCSGAFHITWSSLGYSVMTIILTFLKHFKQLLKNTRLQLH